MELFYLSIISFLGYFSLFFLPVFVKWNFQHKSVNTEDRIQCLSNSFLKFWLKKKHYHPETEARFFFFFHFPVILTNPSVLHCLTVFVYHPRYIISKSTVSLNKSFSLPAFLSLNKENKVCTEKLSSLISLISDRAGHLTVSLYIYIYSCTYIMSIWGFALLGCYVV